MSPPGRPKGEYRSAQHEGLEVHPPGRPKGEYRSAQHEGLEVHPPGRPKGECQSAPHPGPTMHAPRNTEGGRDDMAADAALRGARRAAGLSRRPMQLRDVEAVLAVEARAYSHPWSRGNFIDSLAAGYPAELLLDEEGGVVGYYVAMVGVDELHLLNITVAPAWQGRGHGPRLLDAVQQRAHAAGLKSLWLEVRQGNLRARALYRRLGFAEVGLRRAYYPAASSREDAVVMSLALQGENPPRDAHGLD